MCRHQIIRGTLPCAAFLFSCLTAAAAMTDLSCSKIQISSSDVQPGPTGSLIWDAEVAPDRPARLSLPVPAGTYISAELSSEDAAHLDVNLIDRHGEIKRRLTRGRRATGELRFVTSGEGSSLLAATSLDTATFRLSFKVCLTPGQQGRSAQKLLSPRLRKLQESLDDSSSIASFWREMEQEGTPLVEPDPDGKMATLTFLYRGAERGVRILGAPSSDHDPMFRLGSSDVWYRSYKVPMTTRLAYQLAPDVPELPLSGWERRAAILATAASDPLNKTSWPADEADPFARQSTVQLPLAPAQRFVGSMNAPKGHLETVSFDSEKLGNRRDLVIYTPEGFDPSNEDTILLVMFDAAEYLEKTDIRSILDNMNSSADLPPIAALLVSNPDRAARAQELPGNDDFANELAGPMLALFSAQTGFTPRPEKTVLAGSSFGGLAAFRIAMAYPERFGNALSMSGSFWWHPEEEDEEGAGYLAGKVIDEQVKPVRFFLGAGLFETGRTGSAGILDTNRHLRDVLRAKGYEVHYQEYAGGHDYLVWRGEVADGLVALFGE